MASCSGGGGGGRPAAAGSGRRRGRRRRSGAAHACPAGRAAHPVAAHVGARADHAAQRFAVAGRARAPAHLRVAVRRLRQLRGAHGQPASGRGLRRRRPRRWVVRPLIFY